MELIEVANIIFKNKSKWKDVTEEDKVKYAFVFNRFFSKRYPELSFLVNDKKTDKSVIMDLWFHFMENKPYPKWFWSKDKKITGLPDKEIEELMIKFDINKKQDVIYLLDKYPDLIKNKK